MLMYFIFNKYDASIKMKQGRVKNKDYYFILNTDISVINDDIISHYAYCSITSKMYLTFLSTAIRSYQDSNNNWITGRDLHILCIDTSRQRIMPFTYESITEEVIINIFYIKGKA